MTVSSGLNFTTLSNRLPTARASTLGGGTAMAVNGARVRANSRDERRHTRGRRPRRRCGRRTPRPDGSASGTSMANSTSSSTRVGSSIELGIDRDERLLAGPRIEVRVSEQGADVGPHARERRPQLMSCILHELLLERPRDSCSAANIVWSAPASRPVSSLRSTAIGMSVRRGAPDDVGGTAHFARRPATTRAGCGA